MKSSLISFFSTKSSLTESNAKKRNCLDRNMECIVLCLWCGGSDVVDVTDVSIRITVHDSTRTSRETFSSTQKKTWLLPNEHLLLYIHVIIVSPNCCYFVHSNAQFWKFGRITWCWWWWWNTTFCLLFCMTVLHENLSCSDCRRTHTRSHTHSVKKIVVLQWKEVQSSHFVLFYIYSLHHVFPFKSFQFTPTSRMRITLGIYFH